MSGGFLLKRRFFFCRILNSGQPELPRCDTGAGLEMPGEMRLVGETAHRCHLGRHLAGAQKPARPADAHIRQIGMGVM